VYFCNAMIDINNFTYTLPDERIAKFPLANRDQSKLLVYKNGTIEHHQFSSIVNHLPGGALLVFNNTKVIPARLHFKKESGANIEVFLLEPVLPSTLMIEAMQCVGSCQWTCTIGNLKRWKKGGTLHKVIGLTQLNATLLDETKQLVEFSWEGNLTFADVVEQSGETPLPPYLKRKAEASDKERYQTVYSKHEGAVAAPTAGLHFTPAILHQFSSRDIHQEFVTLHVSAGTFQPIKTANAMEHAMHREQIIVSKSTIENLLSHRGPIVVVGTTAMRTLETLYWMGASIVADNANPLSIDQHLPYKRNEKNVSKAQALEAILLYMEDHSLEELIGHTSIFIHPGYSFKMCDAIITNFHQPGSTLILLVAAFVGDDWRNIYTEALQNDYRFLSYGDSSLLWKKG
jgi:S-adenosylmethionine:tRNA ribosyltransferase-isomerase